MYSAGPLTLKCDTMLPAMTRTANPTAVVSRIRDRERGVTVHGAARDLASERCRAGKNEPGRHRAAGPKAHSVRPVASASQPRRESDAGRRNRTPAPAVTDATNLAKSASAPGSHAVTKAPIPI